MLLTVAQLREHIDTALGDDAIQRLLDDAEAVIDERLGPAGIVTEYRDGGGTFLFLTRRADAISAVIEAFDTTTPVTLDDDDYRLGSDGVTVRRIDTGTNPRLGWYGGPVQVAYIPADDEARRVRVQIDLVRLALNYQPLVIGETIGDWSQQMAANLAWNYQTEREAILASLVPPLAGFA